VFSRHLESYGTVAGISTSDTPQDENVAYFDLPFLRQASRIGIGIVIHFNIKMDSYDQLQAISDKTDKTSRQTNSNPEKAVVC